ncbi:hypothetical protein NOR_07110 [Metarhizium rileyi]|uniref:Secreted protein n=1 Tax=Metarhizium rileyi (strain RCEF 4871) TaxID=1649241 RepID=A0A166Z0H2_METRR|nr:hypothetical protein NOR_07110 [Metarhizium rileyi RCEF 4871]
MKCAIVIATALAGPGLAVSVLPADSGRDGFQVLRRSDDTDVVRHAATARSRFDNVVNQYIKQFQDAKSIEWARCIKQEETETCRDVLRARNAEFEDFIKTEVPNCRDQFKSCNSDDCISELYVLCSNVVQQKMNKLPRYESSALADLVDARPGPDKNSPAGPIKDIENDHHLQDVQVDQAISDKNTHANYIKNTENGSGGSSASPSISSSEAGSAKGAKAGSSRCRDQKVKTPAA